MADHGTVTALPTDVVLEVTGYDIGGITPVGPTVPTTGQTWPRGAG
jgi:prolyl-tRNA editing enzyme YbaK/EbsC (Cys-tRNA(Pro) deacylase)